MMDGDPRCGQTSELLRIAIAYARRRGAAARQIGGPWPIAPLKEDLQVGNLQVCTTYVGIICDR
jgi:hypothetical protein